MGASSSKQEPKDVYQLPLWFEPRQGLQIPPLQLARIPPIDIADKPKAPPTATALTTASPGYTPKPIPHLENYENLEERETGVASATGETIAVTEASGTLADTFTLSAGSSGFSLELSTSSETSAPKVTASTTGSQFTVSSVSAAATHGSVSVSSSSSSTSGNGVATQSSPDSSNNGSSGPSGRAIAGIVIGILLVLFLLVLGVFLFLRRRRRNRNTPDGDNLPHSSSNLDLPEVAEKAGVTYSKVAPTNIAELPEVQSHNLPPELPTHPMTNMQQVQNENSREEFFTARQQQPVFEVPAAPRSPPPISEPVPIATVAAPVARKPVPGPTSDALEVKAEPIVDRTKTNASVNAPEDVLSEDPEIAQLREEQVRIQEQKNRLLQLQRLEEEQERVQKLLDDRMVALGRR